MHVLFIVGFSIDDNGKNKPIATSYSHFVFCCCSSYSSSYVEFVQLSSNCKMLFWTLFIFYFF